MLAADTAATIATYPAPLLLLRILSSSYFEIVRVSLKFRPSGAITGCTITHAFSPSNVKPRLQKCYFCVKAALTGRRKDLSGRAIPGVARKPWSGDSPP